MRTAAPCSILTGTRRLAPTPPLRARGRRAVRPAAQQRQTTTTEVQHRTDRLLSLTEEFIHHWVHGTREGPSDTVVRALHTVTNTDVVFRSMKPLGKSEFQGMDGLRDMLTLEAHREGGMKPVRAVISAANDEDDSVFCLMEGEACVRFPMLTPEKQEGGETFEHKGYGIVKFDTLLDDTSCCVTALNERWQLAPADMALMAVHVPFPVGETPESEDREVAVRKVLEGCGTELFPNDRVQAMDFDRNAALWNMEKWCRARCTGHDEENLLKQAFKHGEFRMWDGMGVLPMVCGIKPGKEHGSSPRDCIMTCHATLDLVRDAKKHNEITCAMLDRAVCRTHNVGFVHWRSHIHPHNKEESSCVVEGMDMHVFNEEGKITDIWMLRDPMKAEQDMLSSILAPKKESVRTMT